MRLYKVLGPNRMTTHGGYGQWPKPGEWLRVDGVIVPCANGLHLCRKSDLIHWLGPEIWEAESRGEIVKEPDKVVVREARLIRKLDTWNDRTARLFACDCAEEALKLLDDPHPDSVMAVQIARLYADGDATDQELAAAGAAAWEAARDAAWEAARDAAWAAAWAASWEASWEAARGAAWEAARDAAWDAAWAAAWAWQTRRLFHYLKGGA